MRRASLTCLLLIVWACGGRVERHRAGTHDDRGTTGSPTESACMEQQHLYAEYRSQVIAERATNPCDADDDCGTFDDRTGCSPTCSYAIPNSARRGIDDRLYAYAEGNCDTRCPAPPIPPCAPLPAPRCVMGTCQ